VESRPLYTALYIAKILQHNAFQDLDYDPDDTALRPAVPSVRLASQTGHVDGIRLPETGDLDGGCYDGTRVGDRRAPAVDFVSAPSRAILGRLILHLVDWA
jgi:hypothetical protein